MSANLPPVAAEGALLPWLLAALAPASRTRVKEMLGSGRVRVNGTSITRHDHALNVGDRISLGEPSFKKPALTVEILYEDDAIIAIDKPAGLLSVATDGEKLDTAFTRLTGQLEARRAGRAYVVHRLDRDTSGVIVFARTAEARDELQSKWEAVTKLYLAVTEAIPEPAEGVVDNFLAEGENLTVRPAGKDNANARRAVTR